jgi:hypothetical protein
MGSVNMEQRAWRYFIRVLKACQLYIPGSYKWRESFKNYRFSMFLLRAWCTVWTAFAAFGV